MGELYSEAIAWMNLPLTAMLGLVVVYWLTVIFGVFDVNAFDLDFDGDINADVDADHSGSGGDATGALLAFLKFVNADQVPAMIVLTIFSLCLWVLSMMGNHYLNPSHGIVLALLIFFGGLIVSFFVTKVVTAPLAAMFRKIKSAEAEETVEVLGSTGTVRSSVVSTDSGQVEIETNGAPILIQARLSEGNARLKKGDECLVVSEGEDAAYYFVRSLKHEHEQTLNQIEI